MLLFLVAVMAWMLLGISAPWWVWFGFVVLVLEVLREW